MSICCFPNCAYLSETSRMVAVYRKLAESGEAPVMATHGGTYEFILRDEGIPYRIVPPHVSHGRSLDYAAASRGERGFSGGGIYESDGELREHVRHEIQFFQDTHIRVVCIGWTQSCAISTRALGIPLAVTHLASLVPPAMGKMGIPLIEPFDRHLQKLVPEPLISALYHWGMRLDMFIGPFNRIAREFGAKPFTGFLDLMMGDLTLVTDTPEVLGVTRDAMEGWRPRNPRLYSRTPRLRYVGAIYARLFGDLPGDVRAFLDTSRPKLYIALTSSRPEYISSLHSLVKGMDARAVIAATVHETRLEETPDIMVRAHLPSHLVMPLVDLAMIHGGQGSTQTAIASGTPVIGFPFHGEQSMNLKVIERARAGFCLPLRYMKKTHRLRRYIERILSDDSYKRNMERLKSHQDRLDGAGNAAKLIRELAAAT
jgi:UDP:flavonoid glycosyltransferase YjiC (YdhE family)